jgi:hypothetical protein
MLGGWRLIQVAEKFAALLNRPGFTGECVVQ